MIKFKQLLRRVPKKFRIKGESSYCLFKDQRKSSGIPCCDVYRCKKKDCAKKYYSKIVTFYPNKLLKSINHPILHLRL